MFLCSRTESEDLSSEVARHEGKTFDLPFKSVQASHLQSPVVVVLMTVVVMVVVVIVVIVVVVVVLVTVVVVTIVVIVVTVLVVVVPGTSHPGKFEGDRPGQKSRNFVTPTPSLRLGDLTPVGFQ